jgi:signal transduction histidine kinase
LQSSLGQIADPKVQEKVSRAIQMLDESIGVIGTTIFSLTQPVGGDSHLRALVIGAAHDARIALGFEPSVRFEGPIDIGVSDHVVPHIIASVTAVLSIAVVHAEVTRVRVSVVLFDGHLVLTTLANGDVNGNDIDTAKRSSELAKLAASAHLLGGVFTVSADRDGGTRYEWRVPVDT